MLFNEAAESIITILNNIYHSTHVSVMFCRSGEPYKIKCSHSRCEENTLSAGQDCSKCKRKLYENGIDCEQLVLNSLNYIVKMQTGQESIIAWESMSCLNTSTRMLQNYYGLYNGISVIMKPKKDITWCISVFSDDSQNRDDFHARFHSKRTKIERILRTYDESLQIEQ